MRFQNSTKQKVASILSAGLMLFALSGFAGLPLYHQSRVKALNLTAIPENSVYWDVAGCKTAVNTTSYGKLWKLTIVVTRHDLDNNQMKSAGLLVGKKSDGSDFKDVASSNQWWNGATTSFSGYAGPTTEKWYFKVYGTLKHYSTTMWPDGIFTIYTPIHATDYLKVC